MGADSVVEGESRTSPEFEGRYGFVG
jgi:hypothetical protein